MKRASRLVLITLAAACAAAAGCANQRQESGASADGQGTDTSRVVHDPALVKFGKLLAQGGTFVSDQVQQQLAMDYGPSGTVNVATPDFFSTDALKASDPHVSADTGIKSLDQLTTDLAAQYGDTDLATEANKARADYLANNSARDTVFAESSFKITSGYQHNWNYTAGGILDGNLADGQHGLNVGFSGNAELDARVIAAFGGDYRSTLGADDSPVLAVLEGEGGRGFIFPRSVDDVRAMKEGEAFAVTGDGTVVGNLGLDIPFLIENPVSWFTFNLAFTASVQAIIEGKVDVQLIRLGGDQVVVDVGVEHAKTVSTQVGVTDEWGFQGVLDPIAHIDGVKIDLGAIAQAAITNKIGKYTTFDVQAQTSTSDSRMTLTRVVLHLDHGDPSEVAAALGQAIHGDTRLAQALSLRNRLAATDPASLAGANVLVDFDLARGGVSKTRSFGVDAFGMSLLHKTVTSQEGVVTVQGPDGAHGLYFDSLSSTTQGPFRQHGYTRAGIAGLDFTTADPTHPSGEANLVLTVTQGANHLHDAMMIDCSDAVIGAIAGPAAVDAMDGLYDASGRYDAAGALAAFGQSIAAGSYPADLQKLLVDAAQTRAALLADGLPLDGIHPWNGPQVTFTAQMRLDDASIAAVLSRSGDDFSGAVLDYAATISADRTGATSRADTRARLQTKMSGVLTEMGAVFADHGTKYAQLATQEQNVVDQVAVASPLGMATTVIHLPLDGKGNLDANVAGISSDVVVAAQAGHGVDAKVAKALSGITLGSIATMRAKLLLDLVDSELAYANALHDVAGLHLNGEDAVAFPLLALAPSGALMVHVTLNAPSDASLQGFGGNGPLGSFDDSFTAQGAHPVGAGPFDVDALTNASDGSSGQ